MIDGLAQWRTMPALRGKVLATVEHPGWRVEQVADGLGVVAFIFEGRPNVFADATGVLRGGNTAVMRIGSDALGTARAIATHALQPALAEAGLPAGAVVLVDSAARSAGWALFSQRGVALAVARGSGPAVAQLGAIARQAGIPVSLHGAGGAWMIVDETADADALRQMVFHSTDRKVCNTLNVVCLPRRRAAELAGRSLPACGARRRNWAMPISYTSRPMPRHVAPAALFHTTARLRRAEGIVEEPLAEPIAADQLGHEWEWEETPEVTLHSSTTPPKPCALQQVEPALRRLADQPRRRGPRAFLPHDRRALRWQWLYALAGWPVCVGAARAGADQLAGGPPLRAATASLLATASTPSVCASRRPTRTSISSLQAAQPEPRGWKIAFSSPTVGGDDKPV